MKITPIVKSSINYLKLLSEKYNYNHPNFYNRKFDEAHQKINITELDINENKIINQVQLQNLCNKYSFINNVVELRFDTNDLNIYRNSTIEIIKSYLENLYIVNVNYGNDIFKTKDYSRANNIISTRRIEILNDLYKILLYIEIYFKSITNSNKKIVEPNLINNIPVPIIEDEKEIKEFKDLFQSTHSDIMEILIKNKILDKEGKWPKNGSDREAAILLGKLIKSSIIVIPNRKLKLLFPLIKKGLNVNFGYENTSSIIKQVKYSDPLILNDLYYMKLSFLDNI